MILTAETHSNEFLKNIKAYQVFTEHLTQMRQFVHQGGSAKAKQKHLDRGKQLVRDRISALLDPQSNFLELSLFAGHEVYPEIHLPAAGLVTGIGFIHGKACMIVANDPTVKGGTYFPLSVKKHLRAQEIAQRHQLPCIYLVDSGGAYLPLQDQLFPDKDHFGRIFFNQAKMSANGVPQFSIVLGSCTAGGAYIPAMADESIMVKNQGTIFLAGPPLVKAATGEQVSTQDLGGSQVHCRISGVADLEVENETLAFTALRDRFKMLRKQPLHETKFAKPKIPMNKITGFISEDPRFLPDLDGILACLIDGSELQAFKPQYGTTVVCGFASIMGNHVGIVANNGVLTSEAAIKACHFIQLCCQRGMPLVFLQNINGFIVGKQPERNGIAKHGAKMVMAVANACVPKYTIIMGGSYGAGNYAMCGRAYEPDFLWQWPNAKTAVMGGAQAADVLQTIGAKRQTKSQLIEEYNEKSSAYYGSARLWDDGIIHPTETREILGFALSISQFIQTDTPKYGVFRM